MLDIYEYSTCIIMYLYVSVHGVADYCLTYIIVSYVRAYFYSISKPHWKQLFMVLKLFCSDGEYITMWHHIFLQ
jgi:hypothetical protein